MNALRLCNATIRSHQTTGPALSSALSMAAVLHLNAGTLFLRTGQPSEAMRAFADGYRIAYANLGPSNALTLALYDRQRAAALSSRLHPNQARPFPFGISPLGHLLVGGRPVSARARPGSRQKLWSRREDSVRLKQAELLFDLGFEMYRPQDPRKQKQQRRDSPEKEMEGLQQGEQPDDHEREFLEREREPAFALQFAKMSALAALGCPHLSDDPVQEGRDMLRECCPAAGQQHMAPVGVPVDVNTRLSGPGAGAATERRDRNGMVRPFRAGGFSGFFEGYSPRGRPTSSFPSNSSAAEARAQEWRDLERRLVGGFQLGAAELLRLDAFRRQALRKEGGEGGDCVGAGGGRPASSASAAAPTDCGGEEYAVRLLGELKKVREELRETKARAEGGEAEIRELRNWQADQIRMQIAGQRAAPQPSTRKEGIKKTRAMPEESKEASAAPGPASSHLPRPLGLPGQMVLEGSSQWGPSEFPGGGLDRSQGEALGASQETAGEGQDGGCGRAEAGGTPSEGILERLRPGERVVLTPDLEQELTGLRPMTASGLQRVFGANFDTASSESPDFKHEGTDTEDGGMVLKGVNAANEELFLFYEGNAEEAQEHLRQSIDQKNYEYLNSQVEGQWCIGTDPEDPSSCFASNHVKGWAGQGWPAGGTWVFDCGAEKQAVVKLDVEVKGASPTARFEQGLLYHACTATGFCLEGTCFEMDAMFSQCRETCPGQPGAEPDPEGREWSCKVWDSAPPAAPYMDCTLSGCCRDPGFECYCWFPPGADPDDEGQKMCQCHEECPASPRRRLMKDRNDERKRRRRMRAEAASKISLGSAEGWASHGADTAGATVQKPVYTSDGFDFSETELAHTVTQEKVDASGLDFEIDDCDEDWCVFDTYEGMEGWDCTPMQCQRTQMFRGEEEVEEGRPALIKAQQKALDEAPQPFTDLFAPEDLKPVEIPKGKPAAGFGLGSFDTAVTAAAPTVAPPPEEKKKKFPIYDCGGNPLHVKAPVKLLAPAILCAPLAVYAPLLMTGPLFISGGLIVASPVAIIGTATFTGPTIVTAPLIVVAQLSNIATIFFTGPSIILAPTNNIAVMMIATNFITLAPVTNIAVLLLAPDIFDDSFYMFPGDNVKNKLGLTDKDMKKIEDKEVKQIPYKDKEELDFEKNQTVVTVTKDKKGVDVTKEDGVKNGDSPILPIPSLADKVNVILAPAQTINQEVGSKPVPLPQGPIAKTLKIRKGTTLGSFYVMIDAITLVCPRYLRFPGTEPSKDDPLKIFYILPRDLRIVAENNITLSDCVLPMPSDFIKDFPWIPQKIKNNLGPLEALEDKFIPHFAREAVNDKLSVATAVAEGRWPTYNQVYDALTFPTPLFADEKEE
uniref:Uncharacterized protein n=1 Tax=Chromera velia CCMP2878 TaxID=1169474 RepID=A0A0G4F303_9ALVE|eukprot:Cvel_14765.t1-p1 / transcript=Cvel_14765.t1 / gene=Cvel_14765 / organism=Chromera_velia_CCMP2878 / gene_product=hypothetical protein / transcript_product=hypothetical protein / location=Cvel_scaffold1063:7766-22590(+) / protein_length=1363 / sequence_SO=supercontig / SO=protein_coding / is_pseudo=false